MSFAISWLALRGKSHQQLLSQLGLRETANREWMPESEIVASALPSGWYLVFYNRADASFLNASKLASLSAGAEVVTCAVEEHAMVSFAEGWRNGIKVWSVSHDSDRGLTDLNIEGALPGAFASIHEKLSAKQHEAGARSDTDYIFDVPVEVARSETGFRHDAAFDEFEIEPFVVLENSARES